MLRNNLLKLLGFISLTFLPGCIKYYELARSEFPQANPYGDYSDAVYNNLAKVAIYDQFSTEAIFDILWLSDSIRTAYSDIHSQKHGKDENSKTALLRRQLEENKHWISFYVLADVRDKVSSSLTDKNSTWSFYLLTKNGQKINPVSLKEVELEPEYKILFGQKFNLFKRIYLLKFPLNEINEKVESQVEPIFKLIVSSCSKKAEAIFAKDKVEKEKAGLALPEKSKKNGEKKGKLVKKEKTEKILKDEDYYWV